MYVMEAATVCDGGCNHTSRYVTEAATRGRPSVGSPRCRPCSAPPTSSATASSWARSTRSYLLLLVTTHYSLPTTDYLLGALYSKPADCVPLLQLAAWGGARLKVMEGCLKQLQARLAFLFDALVRQLGARRAGSACLRIYLFGLALA